MDPIGARRDVVREARRLGGTVTSVAASLGIAICVVGTLPVADADFLHSENLLLVETDDEWTIWVGLAHCLSIRLNVAIPLLTLYDVAGQLVKRSGFFLHVASA